MIKSVINEFEEVMELPSTEAEIENQMRKLPRAERTGLPRRYVIEHNYRSIRGKFETREQALSTHLTVADYKDWMAKKHYDEEDASTVLFIYANNGDEPQTKKPAKRES